MYRIIIATYFNPITLALASAFYVYSGKLNRQAETAVTVKGRICGQMQYLMETLLRMRCLIKNGANNIISFGRS